MEITCKKCGMPLDDKTKCTCQPSLCLYCCECAPGCECGCSDKKNIE